MKSLVSFLLLANAQSGANASETERILTRLENDWTHALVRRDTATFHRLVAPGFVYTEDATIMNKEALIRSIMADRVTSATTNTDQAIWVLSSGRSTNFRKELFRFSQPRRNFSV